ncbi:hypothetical protein C8F04DRAFT_1337088 [Mycena alexandri]|uniref:Uncharacterized protein n=1 Tax=Mycena alexandri TaxID=1745969 RepID=A0AAD6WQL1_9AGAR|nr:hypothetical protein C8F04DRAFT_1337088 [Mycena alexandri]
MSTLQLINDITTTMISSPDQSTTAGPWNPESWLLDLAVGRKSKEISAELVAKPIPGDESPSSEETLITQFEEVQQRHARLAEQEDGTNMFSTLMSEMSEDEKLATQTVDTSCLAYRVTVPPPMDESGPAYSLIVSGNDLMCAAMDMTTKIAHLVDSIQFAHLSKLYDRVEQHEQSMWVGGEPSEADARQYVRDTYAFLSRAQLMTCILEVPAEDFKKEVEEHNRDQD